MALLVWIRSPLGDLADAVERQLRPIGVDVVRDAPREAPDLIVRDWLPYEAELPEMAQWQQAAPPAQLLLAPRHRVGELLEQPFVDPLVEPFLMPAEAPEMALAIARSLARRGHYLNLGVGHAATDQTASDEGLVGESPALREAVALVRQVATSAGTSVLIQGESGTGKDLLARLVHAATPGRRHRPFVDVNCAAIPSDLLEAELFGFERGAFTHAGRDKPGLMELAHGGTLFLDEIGELNVALQAKLLRVLETGTFRRLGGVTERRSECRVVASTNRNLLDAVQQGLFRLDLYHRLAVFTIHAPSLRERREDIMPIAMQFLLKFAATMKKPLSGFSPAAQALLAGYPFPGNVRELRNIVERAAIVATGPLIVPKDLGLELALLADTAANLPMRDAPARPPVAAALPPTASFGADVPAATTSAQSLEDSERRHVEQVLASVRGNRAQAARILRISLPTLYKKIRKYNLEEVGR